MSFPLSMANTLLATGHVLIHDPPPNATCGSMMTTRADPQRGVYVVNFPTHAPTSP